MNEPRKLLIESNIENEKPCSDLSRRGFLRKTVGTAAAVSAPTLVGLGGLLSSGSAMAWGSWTTSYIYSYDSRIDGLYGYPDGVGLWRYVLQEYGFGDRWYRLQVDWRVASAGGHIQANIYFYDFYDNVIGRYFVDYYLDNNDYQDSNTNLDVSKFPAVVTNLDINKTEEIYPTDPGSPARGEFRRRLQDGDRYQYWVTPMFRNLLNYYWGLSTGVNRSYIRTITNAGSGYLNADSYQIIFHPRNPGGAAEDVVFRFHYVPAPGQAPLKTFAFPGPSRAEALDIRSLNEDILKAQNLLRQKAQLQCGCLTGTAFATAVGVAATSGWTGLGIASSFESFSAAMAGGAAILAAANSCISADNSGALLNGYISNARTVSNTWSRNIPTNTTRNGIFPSRPGTAQGIPDHVLLDLEWYINNVDSPNPPPNHFLMFFDL